MAKVERSITINAPVDKVFAYVADPANEMEWLPGNTDVRDITGQGVGQRWGYTYKMLGLSFKGEDEVLEYTPNQRYVTKSMGGMVSTWTWTFSPEDSGTRLNVVVEYTIPVPVLGKVGEKLALGQIEREADLAAANIKARLEG
jgi:coenzyme Q-binding protein COQ10